MCNTKGTLGKGLHFKHPHGAVPDHAPAVLQLRLERLQGIWANIQTLHGSPKSVLIVCAVLCCAVLCCAVLCCAVLCCAVLCCAVLCCAVLCCAVLCCAVLCCAVCAAPYLTQIECKTVKRLRCQELQTNRLSAKLVLHDNRRNTNAANS